MDPVSLEKALEDRSKNRCWLVWIFLLTSSPGIFNSMHITSYVFLGGDPDFSCNVPVLHLYNWTNEQIRNISTPWGGSERCKVYDWNYTKLGEMGFAASVTYYLKEKKPGLVKCDSYLYDEETPHRTIVSQGGGRKSRSRDRDDAEDRDLLSLPPPQPLNHLPETSIVGTLFVRFGRKKIFGFCCLLYIAAAPVSAFVSSYTVFLVLRILIGIAGSGVYEAGYTILTELTVKNVRAYLGCLYNVSYSVGFVLLPLAAYFTGNWRELQLAISLPTFVLLIHCWFLPESPRWLITRGKLDKASKVLGQDFEPPISSPTVHRDKDPIHPCHKKVTDFLKCFFKLFSTPELRKRILVCYFAWFVAQLYYYAIALNGSNFSVNEYLYVGLNGVAEVPGYLLPLVLLGWVGRKPAAFLLFLLSGLALLTILIIPQGWGVMVVAMVGRLSVSAVFAVIILQTSELFPTEHRNTAIGSSLTIAQLGTMAAPYLVDILFLGDGLLPVCFMVCSGLRATREGKEVGWYVPSSVCGVLALIAAVLILFLPETRFLPMTDTIGEMHQQSHPYNQQ